MTEDQHQSALIQWAQYAPWFPFLFHIPNEQKGGPKRLGKLKKLGLKAGVPDLFLAYPSKGYHGLFLELKAPNRKPTKLQTDMLKTLSSKNYLATWSDELDLSILIIKNYLELP